MDLNKVDLTTPSQKVIAGVGLACVLMIFWFLLPSLIWFFQNTLYLIALVVVTGFLALNYNNIWQYCKQLTWELTKNRISSDKLYYMYRYHEYLLERLANLDKSIQSITAIRSKLERKLTDTLNRHKENKEKAIQFEEEKKPELVIKTMYGKIQIDQGIIDSLSPKLEGIEKQEQYLKDLYDAWAADIEKLKYTLDNKADEYNLLKEMADASGSAKEFLKGDSTEYKEYQESLVQIENSVNSYIGTIDSFERKVNPIMQNLAANQSVDEKAGKALLEEYKKQKIDFTKQLPAKK